ncbi:hypothetical protein OG455_10600 [Kitasatospora sp. NBC_01287]|uniref:hypothetical protein n=1 Tax=Kitasatospora sp. NBC_01287 TaxID=2903573 RepID=UPI00225073D9|nr:hypothetical protein [Kitasatospora sp. NBC_01287]MCX4745969.1 hypothetical protein [Kitasatospora sp. NBC_01287]
MLTYPEATRWWIGTDDDFLPLPAQVGHLGTGDLEVRISSAADLERSAPLLAASFEAAA